VPFGSSNHVVFAASRKFRAGRRPVDGDRPVLHVDLEVVAREMVPVSAIR
jgi:hypothetical protein